MCRYGKAVARDLFFKIYSFFLLFSERRIELPEKCRADAQTTDLIHLFLAPVLYYYQGCIIHYR